MKNNFCYLEELINISFNSSDKNKNPNEYFEEILLKFIHITHFKWLIICKDTRTHSMGLIKEFRGCWYDALLNIPMRGFNPINAIQLRFIHVYTQAWRESIGFKKVGNGEEWSA